MKNIPQKDKNTKIKSAGKPVKVNLHPTLNETVVYSWGRMNPPTKGHEKLVQEMMSQEGDKIIHLSHSELSKRNPLSYEDKLAYAQEAFGDIVKESNYTNIAEALKDLGKHYKNLILYVGEDRIEDFQSMLEKSNDSHFHFENWQVISAGQRRPDSDDISSISASMLREACVVQDSDTILKCLPESLHQYASEIQEKVSKVYNLDESIKMVHKMRNKKQVADCKETLKSAIKIIKK